MCANSSWEKACCNRLAQLPDGVAKSRMWGRSYSISLVRKESQNWADEAAGAEADHLRAAGALRPRVRLVTQEASHRSLCDKGEGWRPQGSTMVQEARAHLQGRLSSGAHPGAEGWRCVLIKQTPPDQEWKILQDMAVIFLINKMKHGEDGRLKNLVTSQVNATCDGLWPLT